MTHAQKRGERTTVFLTNGTISDEHNSFQVSDVLSKDASVIGVPPSVDFE